MWLIGFILTIIPATIVVCSQLFSEAKKNNHSCKEYINYLSKKYGASEEQVYVTTVIFILGCAIMWPAFLSIAAVLITAKYTIKKLESPKKKEW